MGALSRPLPGADQGGPPGTAARGAGGGRAPRLLYLVTDPLTARYLLDGQLRRMARAGFEVHLASAPGPLLDEVARREGVTVHPLPMEREIRPWRDLRALFAGLRLMRRLRPRLVNAGTPKAGLVGMLTARLAGVPARLYTLRGLRLETATGLRRGLLGLAERLTAAAAHRVVCVSPSLRRRYVELGLAPAAKAVVLGAGSSNGVDLERFRPARRGETEPPTLRRGLGLEDTAPVVGFVGRLTRDKGVEEVAAIVDPVLARHPDARFLLLGDFEEGDPVPPPVRRRLAEHPAVTVAGFVDDAAPYYRAIDLLIFPSRREGLPNAPLEAAASGVPVVGYRATGTVDAVADGVTGRLLAAGDRDALAAAVCDYLDRPERRREHGLAGRRRAAELFDRRIVWRAWEAEYRRLLATAPAGRGGVYRRFGKRALDLALALPALLVLAPLLAAVAVAVRARLGRPVLFRQRRPGLAGRPFTIFKFRTMTDRRDAGGNPLSDAERLPRFGALLRRLSLDELPELWNVVRGEMSLVGPRPLLMEYLERYDDHQRRRHEVLPGITGWAQVHGRNVVDWPRRLELDRWYVDNLSLALDLRILALTARLVLTGQGVSAPGHATSPEFPGQRRGDGDD